MHEPNTSPLTVLTEFVRRKMKLQNNLNDTIFKEKDKLKHNSQFIVEMPNYQPQMCYLKTQN